MAVYQFPAANQGAWLAGVDVGVTGGIAQYRPGGINQRTNLIDINDYGADPTGVAESSTAFAAAIAASSEDDVIWVPDGIYYNPLGIGITHDVNNRTIRGESRAGSIIECNANTGIGIGTGAAFTGLEQTITGTKTQGTVVFTVTSSTGYAVGQLVRVAVNNEEDNTRIEAGSEPTFSARGFRYVRYYTTIVVSVGAGTITVATPLPWDATFLTLKIFNMDPLASWRLERVGLETLTIRPRVGETLQFAVQMQYCVECWMYDCDVTVSSGVSSSEVKIADSFRCEVRQNRLHDSNPASDGKLQFSAVTSCFVEDNNFDGDSPALYNSGNTVGNVFSYNFAIEPTVSFLTAHNPYPCLDYFEGNIGAFLFQADHYHGNSARINFFRNWATTADTSLTSGADVPLIGAIKRFGRNYLFAGNVFGVDGLLDALMSLGDPNIGNSDFIGTSEMSAGDFPVDWLLQGTLTTRTSDTEGVFTMASSIGNMYEGQGLGNNGPCVWWNSYANSRISMAVLDITGLAVTLGVSGYDGGDVLPIVGTVVTFWTGSLGYQEKDLDVEGTLVLVQNFVAKEAGDGAIENPLPGGDTLADSNIHTSKPDFFGMLDWPAIGPEMSLASTADYGRIPAGARWLLTVPDSAPEFTSDVEISGSGVEGSLITVTGGFATGNPAPTYTFQLQIDAGGGFDDIPGATTAPFNFPDYTAPGYMVRMKKTATNSIDPFIDVSFSNEIELLDFMGDILTVTQVANAAPVTELWLRGALTSGVAAAPSYYLVQHSGPYPTQPDNNFVYQRFGTPQDHVYVFQGTVSEAEAIASVP